MRKLVDFRVAKFFRYETNGLRGSEVANRNVEPFRIDVVIEFEYDHIPVVFLPEPTAADIQWLMNDEKMDFDE